MLPTLGIYTNSVNPAGVLAPAPNGGAILAAMPDGNVMLYDANADTFTVSRKDFAALSGAYAASSYNSYVVGSNMLNASLVPAGVLETSSGRLPGFAFIDQGGFRTTTSSPSTPGVIERFDATQSAVTGKPTRLVEAPLLSRRHRVRDGGPGLHRDDRHRLRQRDRTELPSYARSFVRPQRGHFALGLRLHRVAVELRCRRCAAQDFSSVVNAADGKLPVAPGGLISVYGQQMAPVNLATSEIPLPTALAESCLTVNGVPVPVLFVSSSQINGQIPFNVDGNAQMTLRTPGGISDNFNFSILPAAPSIFRTGTAGPETGLATITRADNGQLITPTNPVHPGDSIVIWATGLGRTSPPIDSGLPAPSDPLAGAVIVAHRGDRRRQPRRAVRGPRSGLGRSLPNQCHGAEIGAARLGYAARHCARRQLHHSLRARSEVVSQVDKQGRKPGYENAWTINSDSGRHRRGMLRTTVGIRRLSRRRVPQYGAGQQFGRHGNCRLPERRRVRRLRRLQPVQAHRR